MPIRNSIKDWIFPELISVPLEYQLAIGGSSLVAETLFRRGLTSPKDALAFLDPDLYNPAPSSDLPGLPTAADRVSSAITNQEKILVWGDFDVDGQTSTTLLVSALQKLGGIVRHHIPIRATESHGLSLPVLSNLIQEHSPQLIITCDTGVDASAEIDYANQNGIDVIITDHHQLPPNLPEVFALVNPNLLPPSHPLYTLPGVGVAFKLIEEIYSRFSEDPSFLLDLVALGIVADIATQAGDTRYLLQKGLQVLRQSPRSGLLEIYKMNNLQPAEITEEHIGFVIGPRLNALGRLDDANSCVDFFTTNNPAKALTLANRLEDLNATRQLLTQEIFNDAVKMVESYPELVEEFPILVLQGPPQWNPGVIGIVASRLVDRYHVPVIMLAQDDDHAQGSARSIPGIPIADLISSCDDLLISHGGHPMAAGLRLPLVNVSSLRRSLASNFSKMIGDTLPVSTLDIDLEISFQEISETLINDFQRIAPFGAGNPKLVFATRGVFTDLDSVRTIGKSGNHRKLEFKDTNEDRREILWWNGADRPIPEMPLDIAYTLQISTYRNQPQIQATLEALRQSPESPVYITSDADFELVDLRDIDDPYEALSTYYSQNLSTIWAEHQLPENYPSHTRSELTEQEVLIIWSSPPSKLLFSQIIEQVSPRQIILVGINHPQNSLDDFIQSLLGLIKHQQESGKSFDLTGFAEALSFPVEVIEAGLIWIHQHGDLDLSNFDSGKVLPGPRTNLPDFPQTDKVLKHLVREVLAYRSYFKTAHIRAIL